MDSKLDKKIHKDFIFFATPFKLNSNFEIEKGLILKRANKAQLKAIKIIAKNFEETFGNDFRKYEYDYFPFKKKRKFGVGVYKKLEDKNFDYYVLEHKYNEPPRLLQFTFRLSSLKLVMHFEAYYRGVYLADSGEPFPTQRGSRLIPFNYYHDRFHENHKPVIDRVKRKEIRNILRDLKSFYKIISGNEANEFSFIHKAISDYYSILEISEKSPFKTLSYFSILELLLTSSESKNDNQNSYTNQLKTKVNLINSQWQESIDVQAYFKGSISNTIETVVGKLYDYRSNIAHGNFSDFDRKLSMFKKSKNQINSFLEELTRRILLDAIIKPQFYKDLKQC